MKLKKYPTVTKILASKGGARKILVMDFLRDHAKHFGFLPMEVEIDGEILSWDDWQALLTEQDHQELDQIEAAAKNKRIDWSNKLSGEKKKGYIDLHDEKGTPIYKSSVPIGGHKKEMHEAGQKWFKKLSKKEQQEYIELHPHSRYRTQASTSGFPND
jgi:ATP-dependent exoDNAse (exonuclease V) alpha subunit